MVSGHQACIVVLTLVDNGGGCGAGRDATRPNKSFIERDDLDSNYSNDEGCTQLLMSAMTTHHSMEGPSSAFH